MYKAKVNFLNYKPGDVVEDEKLKEYPNWMPFVEEVKEEAPKAAEKPKETKSSIRPKWKRPSL